VTGESGAEFRVSVDDSDELGVRYGGEGRERFCASPRDAGGGAITSSGCARKDRLGTTSGDEEYDGVA
jgi:hypothetical protein